VAVETGYFATSYRLVEALIAIPVLLVGVTFPVLARAARDDRERLRYAARRIFEIAVIGGVWMSLVTALAAGFAIDVIGGDEAAPATEVLHIQALFMTPLFLNVTWQTLLVTLRMHREMMIAALVALAAVLALTLLLIPSLQARGAAIAVVVGETLLMTVEALLLWRVHPDLRPPFGVLPKVLAALALALPPALLLDVHDVARAALASAIYLGVLAALRAIPMELLRALAGRPPKPAG
jgi:O-antigen/teichoic acid export membrane protein